MKCEKCEHEYKEGERAFKTDEYGTYYEEMCPSCHQYI